MVEVVLAIGILAPTSLQLHHIDFVHIRIKSSAVMSNLNIFGTSL